MTTTMVDDAKKPVYESTSLFRIWWTNKNLQYDIVMTCILIILNIAANLYMTHHKIPLTADESSLTVCLLIYLVCGMMSFMGWCMAMTAVEGYDMYICGRIGHIFGLSVLLHLLYSISPSLALWFGIPSLLWVFAAFIEALYALCLPQLFKALRDHWDYLNQPLLRVVNV
ncbi:unnamed protein product [Arabidopsis thaliana]|uniref:(thale cress) hypothetical protein n=1 Tax=Arabidopsis thaliana TaxID=3702 RepID=A0A654EG62_ARATH|nr:unnamed protein product [Arabidopsis thaliana]CAD5314807.1 unnamed protein product [Arabidopsis thaliana]VYS48326.1 unnamed protein product [Arabidopsis thaliana]